MALPAGRRRIDALLMQVVKGPVIVAKLDRLSRDVHFISGFNGMCIGLCVLQAPRMQTKPDPGMTLEREAILGTPGRSTAAR
jgi:hypothetical protein